MAHNKSSQLHNAGFLTSIESSCNGKLNLIDFNWRFTYASSTTTNKQKIHSFNQNSRLGSLYNRRRIFPWKNMEMSSILCDSDFCGRPERRLYCKCALCILKPPPPRTIRMPVLQKAEKENRAFESSSDKEKFFIFGCQEIQKMRVERWNVMLFLHFKV